MELDRRQNISLIQDTKLISKILIILELFIELGIILLNDDVLKEKRPS